MAELPKSPWMTFKPGQIFPRSFRWILNSDTHPEIQWWLVRLKTDYLNQIISLEIHDDIGGAVYNWIQALLKNGPDESLQLSHLDGVGDSLYLVNFKNLRVVEHATLYDYKLQTILTHTMQVKYVTVERQIAPAKRLL